MADWKYKDYTESEKVKNAYQQYAAQKANKPGEYKSAWQGQLDDMLSKIQGREKFSFDANSDAVYQQYKNQFMQGGKLAMQDTMGQAAALTGGYTNSYGVTAANQAYQQYLTGLTDKIPELYSLAYDKYNQEGQDMLTQYGLLQDRENTDYSRYRDKVSDYETALDRLYNIYNNERSFDYGQYGDNRSLAYQQYRDVIADEQAAAQLAEQQRQFNENLAWQKQQAAMSAASSGSGSSKSSSKAYNMSNAEEEKLQGYLTNRDYEAADEYITILRSRGLSDDEAVLWLNKIPQWYWEGGHYGYASTAIPTEPTPYQIYATNKGIASQHRYAKK